MATNDVTVIKTIDIKYVNGYIKSNGTYVANSHAISTIARPEPDSYYRFTVSGQHNRFMIYGKTGNIYELIDSVWSTDIIENSTDTLIVNSAEYTELFCLIWYDLKSMPTTYNVKVESVVPAVSICVKDQPIAISYRNAYVSGSGYVKSTNAGTHKGALISVSPYRYYKITLLDPEINKHNRFIVYGKNDTACELLSRISTSLTAEDTLTVYSKEYKQLFFFFWYGANAPQDIDIQLSVELIDDILSMGQGPAEEIDTHSEEYLKHEEGMTYPNLHRAVESIDSTDSDDKLIDAEYQLSIQGVNSYRTTMLDEIDTLNQSEIP